MNARFIPGLLAAVCLLVTGCHSPAPSSVSNAMLSPPQQAAAANQLFLNQKTFDPWVFESSNLDNPIPSYFSDGRASDVFDSSIRAITQCQAGHYDKSGQLILIKGKSIYGQVASYQQTLDLRLGTLSTMVSSKNSKETTHGGYPTNNWPQIWQTADIVITGDPEAQQVTHANMFYLLSSTYPGSNNSIPPFGLSSNLYGGHIFWDADVWMLPALIVQHPEYAKPIVDYRFKILGQAKKNAKMHGFAGAEYAWESADTGVELVGPEFARERHVTADAGWAAWQYYLWTGDKQYLANEGWPLLQATAAYWASRVTRGADGKYHIKGVLSPDETAGEVDDDAWTNAVVQANLRAATRAAKITGQPADPRWAVIAESIYFPVDKARGIPAENDTPMTDRFAAKQADTLLLIHPLHVPFDPATAGKMLDFYAAHTIKSGPAMTGSIQTIVAAKLGRAQESLDQFHDSYRPFMRGPWDAFSEKRSSNRVYFCTGMGGCLQSVLYGFAGLQIVEPGGKVTGTKIAGDGEASLYVDPHLPPGWGGLTVKGVKFRGKTCDVAITPGNKVTTVAVKH